MIRAIADATRTPSMIPGASDGRTTSRQRCAGDSPRCATFPAAPQMERIAVAAFSRIGHETISATTATPLIWFGPSNRTATGTSPGPVRGRAG